MNKINDYSEGKRGMKINSGKISRALAASWPILKHDHFEANLRKIAAGYFQRKEFPVQKKYPFILANRGNWALNIILEEVRDFIHKERDERIKKRVGFPLHKYLHHGLSSQAMLFNLVGPLATRNDFKPLRDVVKKKVDDWAGENISAHFEVEDRSVFNESFGQPTSIDLVVTNASAPPLFIEAKFVEREFGGCTIFGRGDCNGKNPFGDPAKCYLHHIGRRYWELIIRFEILSLEWMNSPICPFASYSQFFRELLFAIYHDGYYILLYDERNPSFYYKSPDGFHGLFVFVVSLLTQESRVRTARISVQELYQSILGSGDHTDWIYEFGDKYGLRANSL